MSTHCGGPGVGARSGRRRCPTGSSRSRTRWPSPAARGPAASAPATRPPRPSARRPCSAPRPRGAGRPRSPRASAANLRAPRPTPRTTRRLRGQKAPSAPARPTGRPRAPARGWRGSPRRRCAGRRARGPEVRPGARRRQDPSARQLPRRALRAARANQRRPPGALGPARQSPAPPVIGSRAGGLGSPELSASQHPLKNKTKKNK